VGMHFDGREIVQDRKTLPDISLGQRSLVLLVP
jgi:hypothetical protein